MSLRARLDEQGDGYVFGLARVAFALLLTQQTWRLLQRTLEHGYFGDRFHLPLLPDALVPSAGVFLGLLGLRLLLGVLVVGGWFSREALALHALLGIHWLLCDRLQYHNNRFALCLLAFLCAFTPCDRSWLFFRGRAHTLPALERRGPTWARHLLAIQISAIYLASGGGKLLDPDWFGGQTMLVRFVDGIDKLTRAGWAIPEWLITVASAPWFASLASKAAISLELSLAFGLWWRRTRVVALWVGVMFHLGIEVSSRVELFSWLMGAGYVAAFVTPELRERTLLIDPGWRFARSLRGAVSLLDWLARLRLEEGRQGPAGPVVLVDRGGERLNGLAAAAGVARVIPLFFVFWGPLALLSILTARTVSRS
jgi:hypothetical protein